MDIAMLPKPIEIPHTTSLRVNNDRLANGSFDSVMLNSSTTLKYDQDNSFKAAIIQTCTFAHRLNVEEILVSYPPGHRAAIRAKIIESARRLFNRHGFDGVSVKQIMSGAGLTHGAFYSYFKGKSDLYTEVLGWPTQKDEGFEPAHMTSSPALGKRCNSVPARQINPPRNVNGRMVRIA